jgi:hypothetical protein
MLVFLLHPSWHCSDQKDLGHVKALKMRAAKLVLKLPFFQSSHAG